jgi:hypothetical protein
MDYVVSAPSTWSWLFVTTRPGISAKSLQLMHTIQALADLAGSPCRSTCLFRKSFPSRHASDAHLPNDGIHHLLFIRPKLFMERHQTSGSTNYSHR